MIPIQTLKQLFDSYSEGVFIINRNFVFDYINPKASEIVAIDFEEKLGGNGEGYYGLYYLHSGEKIPLDKYPATKALMGEFIDNEEMIIKNAGNPEGTLISVTATPIFDEKGAIAQAIVTFRDISKFSEVEERLEDDKLNLESVLKRRTEKLELINNILTASHEKKTINAYFEKVVKDICLCLRYDVSQLYELKKDELHLTDAYYAHNHDDLNVIKALKEKGTYKARGDSTSLSYYDLSPESELSDDVRSFEEGFVKQGVKSVLSLPVLSNNKVTHVIVFMSNSLKKEGMKSENFNRFLQDLSQIIGNSIHHFQKEGILLEENRSLAQRIEEKDRVLQKLTNVKEEFVAKIGHELRTPLNAILGYAEMSMEDFRASIYDDLSDHNKKIKDSANNLLGMVTNLINISDISSTKVTKTVVDPLKFLGEIEVSFQEVVKENNNNLSLTFGVESGTFSTDAEKLRVVLSNIISNACKFTQNGDINISLVCEYGEESSNAIFEISDTGCGIDQASLESLFNSFNQSDNSHTREFDGLGVGLHLSKLYADMIDATIHVKSEKGRGSSFKILVPMK